MTDSDDKNKSRDSKSDSLGLGDRLRSARKASALSLEQIAESLHLDETLVLALEAEQFESLGAPVFVRGHLKAYARLVGVPEDSILDSYKSADPGSESVPRIARESNRSVSINPVTWGIWALVAFLVLILGIYVLQDDEPPSSVRRDRAATASDVPAPQALSEVPAAADPETEPEPEPEPVPKSEPAAAEPVAPPEPEPAPFDRNVRLTLVFGNESWVEIRDANRRLLFGLQRAGRRRELVGEPPFDLTLGNARGIELFINDAPYSIPRRSITGKVARFEISSSDVE